MMTTATQKRAFISFEFGVLLQSNMSKHVCYTSVVCLGVGAGWSRLGKTETLTGSSAAANMTVGSRAAMTCDERSPFV